MPGKPHFQDKLVSVGGKENTKRRNFKSLVGKNGRVKGVVLGGVWEGVNMPKIHYMKFSRN